MRTKKYISLLVASIFFGISSCKKDEHTVSTTPEITFVSITPSTAKEYQDAITISIKYKDGDGDLGENDAGVKNVFVTDSRNGVTYALRVQQLAPTGAKIIIEGTVNIQLTNTAITNGTSAQSVSYSVHMIDRAGNKSNTVNTSAIIVTQ